MEKIYLNATEVAKICDVGRSRAYEIINAANEELAKSGKYVIRHRVSKSFLFKFLGLEE